MTELRGFKFVTTLVLKLKKITKNDDETKYSTFYSSSESDIIINDTYIDDTPESIYSTIMSKIQKPIGKSSSWVIDSMINHTIDILKCKPVNGSRYPKESDYPRKYR